MKIKVRTNLWAGIFSLASAITIWLAIPFQIGSAGDSVSTNPRLFPQIFCVIIGIVGLILLFNSLVLHQEDVKEYHLTEEGQKLLYYAIVILYVLCIGWFGFLIPSILFGIVTLAYARCRKPIYYIIAVCFAVVLYLVFTYVLGVHFP